jgi:hypothetical protein
MLKDLLKSHSIQRPPFQIFIFSEREVEKIISFSLTTFLRHFSLYEFAFKPRIDMVLHTHPVFNTQFNAAQMDLEAMTQVEKEEASNMKMFLQGLGNRQHIQEIDMSGHPHSTHMRNTAEMIATGQSKYKSTHQSIEDGEASIGQESVRAEPVDFRKVGRAYNSGEAIESVISAEMARIHRAFDERVVRHTDEMLTKVQTG